MLVLQAILIILKLLPTDTALFSWEQVLHEHFTLNEMRTVPKYLYVEDFHKVSWWIILGSVTFVL